MNRSERPLTFIHFDKKWCETKISPSGVVRSASHDDNQQKQKQKNARHEIREDQSIDATNFSMQQIFCTEQNPHLISEKSERKQLKTFENG